MSGKVEVNLEIGTGFFRITTDKLLYNITVLGAPDSGRPAAPPPAPPAEARQELSPVALSCPGDDFYRQVSNDIFHDIGNLAKSLSSTIMELPAEDRKMRRVDLDEAGEKIEDAKNQLRDIVSMTERATMEIMDHVEKVQLQTDGVRALLSQLKGHHAFSQSEEQPAGEGAAGSAVLEENLGQLDQQLARAGELLSRLTAGSPGADKMPPAAARRRYLFELDTVFQTIYELCTNETVKSHISAAREKAAELFDYDAFVEAISARVSQLEPDSDNFYTVPLSDVLGSLALACNEKKIQNLFAKMGSNQKEIFLDASLPLEGPAVEEVAADKAAPAGYDREALAEMGEVLTETMALSGRLREALPSLSNGDSNVGVVSREDQLDLFHKIEGAFGSVNSIYEDVARITEALSFQDLSGQQIFKIIKLLSDFQVQLLALVVSFGSQLKIKERNTEISVEESKRLAQEDVNRYLKTMTGEAEPEGPLDQETVNRMLEEFGF